MNTDFFTLVREVWRSGVFGLDVGGVVLAFGIFLVFLVLRGLFTRFVLGAIDRFVQRSQTDLDEKILQVFRQPLRFMFLVLGAYFAVSSLPLAGQMESIADKFLRSLIAYAIFWLMYNAASLLAGGLQRLQRVLTPESLNWIARSVRVFVAFVGGATILEIWGINVAPILAGLGVGGVALALGAQDLFKNLIGGAAVLLERRFRVGDWIMVEGVVEGTVEDIGYRSTMVRRFDKAPVFVPNNQLSDTAVTNFSAMTQRRIYWKIGVVYDTTTAQLRQIRDGIEDFIRNSSDYEQPPVVPLFVRIDSFSDSSIDIMVYCFTKTISWGPWLQIKERLAYRIKEIVLGAGSSFAFPSRSLYVESLPAGTPARFAAPSAAALPPLEAASGPDEPGADAPGADAPGAGAASEE